MTKLIIETEIDLDEIGYDISKNGGSFDRAMKKIAEQEVVKRVTEKVISTISEEQINNLAGRVKQNIEEKVEKKMLSLLEEDLVLMDRWGKKIFVGSVEDYIKQEIDQKMTAGVDSQGKKISNACGSQQTWLEWYVSSQTKNSCDRMYRRAEEIIDKNMKDLIHNAFFKAKQDTMRGEILKHLASVGVVTE